MYNTAESISNMFSKIAVRTTDMEFVYFIDETNIWTESGGNILGNITPDYEKLLLCGLNSMKYDDENTKFERDQNIVINSIISLAERICESEKKAGTEYSDRHVEWFENIITSSAKSFKEAIQRVLFVNQIIWQTNHRLIGLGRLDKILAPYYDADIKSGKLNRNEAFDNICTFLKILHKDYKFKSNMLLGDTGQVIVVGGTDSNGEYVYNELTEMFITAVNKLHQPDPKVLLRVSEKTPEKIYDIAVECMNTGCGSPLLSNDDAVIPRLVSFGIPEEDAVNYSVSACWEPLIAGKDSSLNNVTTLNFMKAMSNLFARDDVSKIISFKDFMKRYYLYLSWNLTAIKRIVSMVRFQYDPVLSLFMEGCSENRKDLAHGGAVYQDIGITTVALSNTVY